MMRFQAAFTALVPRAGVQGSQVTIDNTNSVFTWERQLLPFTVPHGHALDITDVHFASKHVCYNGNIRTSYLVLNNIMSVTESGPTVSLKTPFRIPAGKTLEASFINNSPEDQWMNGFILGQLVKLN